MPEKREREEGSSSKRISKFRCPSGVEETGSAVQLFHLLVQDVSLLCAAVERLEQSVAAQMDSIKALLREEDLTESEV